MEALLNDARVRVRAGRVPAAAGDAVVYWMRRAQRAIDNPALETALAAANLLDKPVVVYFALTASIRNANARHYQFMLEGLADVARDLARRQVGFVIRCDPHHDVVKFCADVAGVLLISDENPLRESERHVDRVAARLRIPFWTVAADVIVPIRLLVKEQYAARTIRPRIHKHLAAHLRAIKKIKPQRHWQPPRGLAQVPLDSRLPDVLDIDRSVHPAGDFTGGTSQARKALRSFLKHKLDGYAVNRNHPNRDATSRLSPYLHFGHIGPHTLALAVNKAGCADDDKSSYLEELIVRRELAHNFVHFNPNYDSLDCCEPWALKTLREHAADQREYLYTDRQLEDAETHDPLWNAGQKQMVLAGWMHGYIRMYWAKKILEWTASPAEAFARAVTLNDKYQLDGRDPSGYAGIAWAIGGKHDRAWSERPIFGKIRYMSFNSTSRKFDSQAYIKQVTLLEKGAQ